MYSFESLSLNTRQGSGVVHFIVLAALHPLCISENYLQQSKLGHMVMRVLAMSVTHVTYLESEIQIDMNT